MLPEHGQARRLAVQAYSDDGAVKDQADDLVLAEVSLLPGFPVDLHLVPSAADRVLADRTPEQGRQGSPHAPRVRAGQVGAGDQPLGSGREALVSW